MSPLRLPALLRHGAFGLPLAMVALPIYLYVPQFYAQQGKLSLALLGTLLLITRIGAALLDPLIGLWIHQRSAPYARCVAIALPLLLGGFGMLFHPPAGAPLGWALAALLLVHTGFGLASIAYQSWGAALAHRPGERARLTAVREAFGMAGVVLSISVASAWGMEALIVAFALTLLVGAALLQSGAAPPWRPAGGGGAVVFRRAGPGPVLAPLAEPRFRALFGVVVVSGLANALPATLFMFFVADRLQLAGHAGLFLLLYFGAAAASMPLWVALARALGEARAWCTAMLLAALVFCWAYALPPGAVLRFVAICCLSGLAMGADLALPPALLAGVIRQAEAGSGAEAPYVGVWNWGVQMTLALAAGIALPLLQAQGYVPGSASGAGALAAAYALLPCALKLWAAALLHNAPLRDC